MEKPPARSPSVVPRTHRRALVAILLVAAVVRLLILLTSGGYLRSDEAVVGIMARHIVARGELPVFLYGQDYGGGHALVAYLAAPLCWLLGMSGTLLTSISVTFGLANVVILFLLLRKYFSKWVTWGATVLYAVAPPVVSGNFLVNGGTEAVFFSLVGLYFFLSDFYDEQPRAWRLPLLGVMSGVAYWCMDFTAVYPVTYVILWLLFRRRQFLRKLSLFLPGVVVGAAPVLYYDATHNLAHLLKMAPGLAGGAVAGHVSEAFASMWLHDLPGSLTARIDDFGESVPLDSWAYYVAFLLAWVVCLVWTFRGRRDGPSELRPPPLLLPLIYLAVFCFAYCLSRFSLPYLRTPRYFLPLHPFFSVVLVHGFIELSRRRAVRLAAAGVVALLLVQGVARDTGLMFEDIHLEHRIPTSGKAIRELVGFLDAQGIRYVWTPYEIQWRVIFESRERIIASCDGISPINRYPYYDRVVSEHAIRGNEPYAVVFRKDFKFAELAARGHEGRAAGFITKERWYDLLRGTGVACKTVEAGGEFVVFYDFSENIVRKLAGGP